MGTRLRNRLRAAAVAATVCALAWGAAGTARADTHLAAGRFLVATRAQQGFFAETVILLVAYGPDGAFGLVVNRPTRVSLTQALPAEQELRGRKDSVFLGGPVQIDQVTLLVRTAAPPRHAIHVVGDVYASGRLDVLRSVAARDARAHGKQFRAYAGYAGWTAGQLEAEVSGGDWIVVSANPDTIFTSKPRQLWNLLIRQTSTRVVAL